MIMHRREVFAWLSIAFASLLTYWLSQPQEPYTNVEVISILRTENSVDLIASFEKTDCEFRELRPVGGFFGQTEFLEWSDIDGLPNDHDRHLGKQTLRISIQIDKEYEWIEIRTRHDCDGEKVDKVFARIQPIPEAGE